MENCSPEDIDWSKETLEEVVYAAEQGITSAKIELKTRFSTIVKDAQPDFAKFVPSKLEVERAKSRLKILPNPPQVPEDIDPEKVVEVAWKVTPTITVDPNIWDTAELALVRFEDLTATDEYLRRKKLKEHIEAMGGAITSYRNFALVVERDGEQIIIDGHHRLMAMWLLGMTEAPVWLAKEN